MNYRRVLLGFVILVLAGMVFYAGFLFGYREIVNDQPDTTLVIGANGARKNILTDINRRPVFATVDTRNIQVVGEMLFVQATDSETQILITLNSPPVLVRQTETKREKAVPRELSVNLARRSVDGLDYVYEQIGTFFITTGSFSTVLEKPLFGPKSAGLVERIELKELRFEDENIFKDDNPDLPAFVRARPAPYFWINI